MIEQLLRLYHTLRPLKPRQWWCRLVQPVMKRCARLRDAPPRAVAAALAHPRIPLLGQQVAGSYDPSGGIFRFLNLEARFPDGIDWNYRGHGLLWLYNLHYFEWLYDDGLTVEARMQSIHSYLAAGDTRVGLDGYPASLRIVAWTRFLLRYGVRDEAICRRLYRHADWLCRFPEYHLDGNHLWENAIALTVAGCYFQDGRLYAKGRSILTACVDEQLFADGGHVEGSLMYHSLLLWRTLQCIELMRALPMERDGWPARLVVASGKMLGWLSAVTFSDGSWPSVNDSTGGIAPTTASLKAYAEQLSVPEVPTTLGDSGYRMIRTGAFELFIDTADIRPAYQPGHAHADTGSFCLHIRGKPCVVDTGISTYETGDLRSWQRGSEAHNIVSVQGVNSSDVWRSFRVGRRAVVSGFREDNHTVELSHNGYAPAVFRRTFSWDDATICITDSFEDPANRVAELNLHFHPDIIFNNPIHNSYIIEGASVTFATQVVNEMLRYYWAPRFNQLVEAPAIKAVIVGKTLITIFRII